MKKLLLLLTLLMSPLLAMAHVFDQSECETVANVAGMITAARDAGQPLDALKSAMSAGMQNAIGQDGSVVQDKDDIARFLRLADQIYAHTDMTPEDVAQDIYGTCMRKALQHKKAT